MKKVVVVAKGKQIVFTGKDLKVFNKNEKTQVATASSILVVKDRDEVIAVFKRWSYWRKVDDDSNNEVLERICLHCGKGFTPTFEKQRFCEKHRPKR